MQSTEMYPPGRVLWALRDTDLHVSHRVSGARTPPPGGDNSKDKLRLFEVLDASKVFSQIVFARDMLRWVSSFALGHFLVDSDK